MPILAPDADDRPRVWSANAKRRPCCNEGTVLRAVATLAGSIVASTMPGSVPPPSASTDAPGIDDQRMAEGLALVLVQPGLRGGEHEAAVLDGAGAQQRVPMRFAGLFGEGRGHREERRAGFRQRAIQRREAHVVADRHAEPAPRQVGDHSGLARLIVGGLAIAFAVCRDRYRTCGSCRSARGCRRTVRSGTSG